MRDGSREIERYKRRRDEERLETRGTIGGMGR